MQVQKFLGKGAFGSVYRVVRLSDNMVYAVKETCAPLSPLDLNNCWRACKVERRNRLDFLPVLRIYIV